MTRADSRRAQWGPMTSESLGCASCLSAQAAIMGAKFSCCTNLHQRCAAESAQTLPMQRCAPSLAYLGVVSHHGT